MAALDWLSVFFGSVNTLRHEIGRVLHHFRHRFDNTENEKDNIDDEMATAFYHAVNDDAVDPTVLRVVFFVLMFSCADFAQHVTSVIAEDAYHTYKKVWIDVVSFCGFDTNTNAPVAVQNITTALGAMKAIIAVMMGDEHTVQVALRWCCTNVPI